MTYYKYRVLILAIINRIQAQKQSVVAQRGKLFTEYMNTRFAKDQALMIVYFDFR